MNPHRDHPAGNDTAAAQSAPEASAGDRVLEISHAQMNAAHDNGEAVPIRPDRPLARPLRRLLVGRLRERMAPHHRRTDGDRHRPASGPGTRRRYVRWCPAVIPDAQAQREGPMSRERWPSMMVSLPT